MWSGQFCMRIWIRPFGKYTSSSSFLILHVESLLKIAVWNFYFCKPSSCSANLLHRDTWALESLFILLTRPERHCEQFPLKRGTPCCWQQLKHLLQGEKGAHLCCGGGSKDCSQAQFCMLGPPTLQLYLIPMTQRSLSTAMGWRKLATATLKHSELQDLLFFSNNCWNRSKYIMRSDVVSV